VDCEGRRKEYKDSFGDACETTMNALLADN